MTKTHVELQMHPYFEYYPLIELVKAMERRGLEIIAPEQLNAQIFDKIRELASGLDVYGYKVDSDSLALKIEKDGKQKFIIRARESDTSDGFHILTIGLDDFQSYRPIGEIIEDTLRHEAIPIFDHPFVDNGNVLKGIKPEKRKEVGRVCRQYSGNLALEWNGYCKELYWRVNKFLGGIDVNQEVIRFSRNLSSEGYNVPVVTDTDVHARNVDALDAIGTGRIIVDNVDFTSGESIITSLRKAIFSGEYENTYRTVPFQHFTLHFAIPYLSAKIPGLNRLYSRPRG